jgi:superoxide reductase
MNVNNEKEIFKCEICGNIVSIVEVGGGELVCCGEPMKLLEEKTSAEEGKEKHVPVIEIDGNKVTVKVGSVEHPMESEHYIEFIQLIKGDKVLFEKKLHPGEKPEAVFIVDDTNGLIAREVCNLHGLWTN